MNAPGQIHGEIMAADRDLVLDHLRPMRKELEGARIFITGGTGFIGCWLLESLAWANERLGLGAKALVLTRNVEAFSRKAPHLARRPDIRFQVGDVRDFAFSKEQFSHVIHAANDSDRDSNAKNHKLMYETIYEGTQRALDFAVRSGAGQFLLTSSGAVYGTQPPALSYVPEDYEEGPNVSAPDSAHGDAKRKSKKLCQEPTSLPRAVELHHLGKRMSEWLCAMYARDYGLEVKIARIYALTGPYLPLDLHFAMGNFIRDALAGGPIKIQGDGTPYRSYLYAADLTIWLWTILVRGVSNRPYNVGSRNPVSIAELAEAVSRALPGRVPVEIAQKPVPGQPAARYVPETARARQELGLREWTRLDEAIRRTAQWYKETK